MLFYKKYPLEFKWAVPMLFRSYRKIMTSRVLCWMFVFDPVSEKLRKNQNPAKNEPRPVRRVLLENFRAEHFTVKLRRFNFSKLVCLLSRMVTQPMMPGILKLRKENYPERAKGGGGRFFRSFSEIAS